MFLSKGCGGGLFKGILEFCLYFSPSFECEPKRKQCKISSFSFFSYTKSASPFMWHSLVPIKSPFSAWSLYFGSKISSFASFSMTARSSL